MGTLATRILSDNVDSYLQTKYSGARSYSKYREMFALDDVTSLAHKALSLLVVSMIGSYTSADQRAIDNVINSFAYQGQNVNSKERIKIANVNQNSFFLECMSFYPFGFAYAPLAYDTRGDEARLSRYMFLEQEHIRFEGTRRTIDKVWYLSQEMKYTSKLHLVNDSALSGYSPYGYAAAERAIRSWDLHKIFMDAYAIAGQQQATKLLIGKTATERDIEIGQKEDGTPITTKQGELMETALGSAGNSSYIVIGRDDEVEAIDQTTDPDWFLKGFYRGDATRFRSFGFPQTSFAGNEGGKGDASLAENQQQMLLMFCEGLAKYLTTEFVAQGLDPMLSFNGYSTAGLYTVERQNPKALAIAETLIKAISADVVGDKDTAVDKLRSLIGV